MTANDAALVARTLAGETAAYDALVRRHFSVAMATARALTSTREDAEDACQDAFARAYFRLDTCHDPARFGAWIAQIVRRRAHNLRAYQALRACAILDEQVADANVGADGGAAQRELRAALTEALARLSPVKRAVVLQFDVHGWTHEQIAAHHGISTMMSRRHLSDARRQLRGLLAPLGYGDDDV